jgi:ATP-binding cassette, subfamily B, bacterial
MNRRPRAAPRGRAPLEGTALPGLQGAASHPPGAGGGESGGDLRDLRWALSFVLPYRRALILVATLSLVSTGFALYLPYLSKELVDQALLGRDVGALFRITGIFVGITVVSFLINVWSGLRYTKASADILFDMRLLVYEHLQRLSPRFWAQTSLGEVVSRINNDVGEIQRVAGETALGWFGNVIFLVGTVAMLIWLDWRLFLVSAAVFPVAVWALVHYRRKLEGRVAVMRARSADIGSFLIESIQGMRLISGSNAQDREAARFRERNDRFIDALMSMSKLRYLAGGLPGILLSVGTALVFLYGGWRVIGGAITLGTFIAFMAYQMRLLSPVQGLMGIYSNLATARVSLQRVRALLDTLPEVEEAETPVPLPNARGEIVLEDVRLTHHRGDPVLDAVSLEVCPGEVVALVGASGSGKSTIVDLLTRHIDPDRGRLLLDGHDLRNLALRDLRRQVAAVDQDTFLFRASLADNLRFARPEATANEVEAAARAAGIHDFITTLPDGYDTVVGERGATLSAGERQRIALARAFLADPAVLVLDEATANLEPTAEARVVRGYEEAMKGRTTILVSHRWELVRTADRVVVLERGRIAQEGTPDELAARGGAFGRIFGTGVGAELRRASSSRYSSAALPDGGR